MIVLLNIVNLTLILIGIITSVAPDIISQQYIHTDWSEINTVCLSAKYGNSDLLVDSVALRSDFMDVQVSMGLRYPHMVHGRCCLWQVMGLIVKY